MINRYFSPFSISVSYPQNVGASNCSLHLNEILRADLNDDGVEDILLGYHEWTLEGTYGAGGTVALTRLGKDQPFTIVENIELNVRETL